MPINWNELNENKPRLVRYQGRLVDVAEFEALPIGKRPTEIFCPECAEKVFLRLGDVRRPHYAHFNNSGCSGSSESHVHWRTKGEFADAFGRVTQAKVYMRCGKCRQFKVTHQNPIQLWEKAREEHSIGKYRADVALIDNKNNLLLAIEVLVTHEVDDEKRAYFERNKVPWVEVLPNDNSPILIIDKQLHIHASRFGNMGIEDVLCRDCRKGNQNRETLVERRFEDEWILAEQYGGFCILPRKTP